MVLTGEQHSSDGTTAHLNVDATLGDNSGNSAVTKLVSAAFVGFLDSAVVEARVIRLVDTGGSIIDPPVPVTFSKPVKRAAALLVGFDMARTDDDMDVWKIVVIAFVESIEGSTVNIWGWARLINAYEQLMSGSATVLVLATF